MPLNSFKIIELNSLMFCIFHPYKQLYKNNARCNNRNKIYYNVIVITSSNSYSSIGLGRSIRYNGFIRIQRLRYRYILHQNIITASICSKLNSPILFYTIQLLILAGSTERK